MNKKLNTALKRTNHVPYIVLSSKGIIQRMAVWSDIKEVLFFWCVNHKCSIILNILKERFNYPASEKYLKPCTQSEHLQFLREFIIVAPGTLLVDLSCLQNRPALMEIYDAVKVAHARSSDPSAVVCNIQQAKKLQMLNYSFPMPANIMIRKKFLPAISRQAGLKWPEMSSINVDGQLTGNVNTGATADKNVIVTRNKNQRAWTVSQSTSRDKLHGHKEGGSKLPLSSLLYGVRYGEVDQALVPLSLLKESFPQSLGLLEEAAQRFILQKPNPDFPSISLCSHTEGVHLTRFLISNRGYDRRWSSLTTLSLLMSWSDFFEQIRRDDLRLFLKLKTVSVVVLKAKTAEILKSGKSVTTPKSTAAEPTSGEVVPIASCTTLKESAQHFETVVSKNDTCDIGSPEKLKKSLKSSRSNTSQVGNYEIIGQSKAGLGKSDTTIAARTDRLIKSQKVIKKTNVAVNGINSRSQKILSEHTKGKTGPRSRCCVLPDQKLNNNDKSGQDIPADGIITMKKRYTTESSSSNRSSKTSTRLTHERNECKSTSDVVESVLSFSLQNKHAKPACKTNHNFKKKINIGASKSETIKPFDLHTKLIKSNKECSKNFTETNSTNCMSNEKNHNNSAVGEAAGNKQSKLLSNYVNQAVDKNIEPAQSRLCGECIDDPTANEEFDSGVTMVTIQKTLDQSSNNSSITEHAKTSTVTESLVTSSVMPNKDISVDVCEKEPKSSRISTKLIPSLMVPSESIIESLGLKFRLNCPTEKSVSEKSMSPVSKPFVEPLTAAKKCNKEQLYYIKDGPSGNLEKPESLCRVFPTYVELKPSENIRSLLPNTSEYKFPYPATRTAGVCTVNTGHSSPFHNNQLERQSMERAFNEQFYGIPQTHQHVTPGASLSTSGENVDVNTISDKQPVMHTCENKTHTAEHSPVKLSLQKGVSPMCYTQCLAARSNQDNELLSEKCALNKSIELPLNTALSIQEKVKMIQNHYGDKMKAKYSHEVSTSEEIPFQQKVQYFKPNSSIAPAARSNRNVFAKDTFNARIETVSRDVPVPTMDKVQRFSRIAHKTPKKCSSVESNTVIDCPNYGSSSSTTPDIYDEYARKKKFKGFRQEPLSGTKFRPTQNNNIKTGQLSSFNAQFINPEASSQYGIDSSIPIKEGLPNNARTKVVDNVQTVDRNGVNMKLLLKGCCLCENNTCTCNEKVITLKNQCSDTSENQNMVNDLDSATCKSVGFHQSNDEQKICTIVESFTLANEADDCMQEKSVREPCNSRYASVSASDSTLPAPEHASSSTSSSDSSINIQPTMLDEILSAPLEKMSLSDKWTSFIGNTSPHSSHSSESLQNLSAFVNINPVQSINRQVSESFQRPSTNLERYACRQTASGFQMRANSYIPVSPPVIQANSQSDHQAVLVQINSPLYYRASGQDFVREVSGDTTVPPDARYYYLADPHKRYASPHPPVLPFYSNLQQPENTSESKRCNDFTEINHTSNQKTPSMDPNFIETTNTRTSMNYKFHSETNNVSFVSNRSPDQQTNYSDDEVQTKFETNKVVHNDLNKITTTKNMPYNYEHCDDQKTKEIVPQSNSNMALITDINSDNVNRTFDSESLPLPKTLYNSEDTIISNASKNKNFRRTIKEKRAAERINDENDDRTTAYNQSDRTVDKIKIVHLKSSNAENCSYSIKRSNKKTCDVKMPRSAATLHLSFQESEKISKKCVEQKVSKKLRPKTALDFRPRMLGGIHTNSTITSNVTSRPKSCTVEMQLNKLKQCVQSCYIAKQPSDSACKNTQRTSSSTCTNVMSTGTATITANDVSSRTFRQQNEKSDKLPVSVDQIRKRDERYQSRLLRRLKETNLEIIGDAKLISTKDITDSQEQLSPLIEARQQTLKEGVETQASRKQLKKRGQSAKVNKSSKSSNRKKCSTSKNNSDKFNGCIESEAHLCGVIETKNTDTIVALNGSKELNNEEYDLSGGESNTLISCPANNKIYEYTIVPSDKPDTLNSRCPIPRQSNMNGEMHFASDSQTDTGTKMDDMHVSNCDNISDSCNSSSSTCNDANQHNCLINCEKNSLLINDCAKYGFHINCLGNEQAQDHNANNTYQQATCDVSMSTDKVSEPVIPCFTKLDVMTSAADLHVPPTAVLDIVLNNELMTMPVLPPVNDIHSTTVNCEHNLVDMQPTIINQVVECDAHSSDSLIAVEQNISDDAEITYTITAGNDTSVIISNKHPHFKKILQYFQQQQINPESESIISGQNMIGKQESPVEDESVNQEIITVITECIVNEHGEIDTDDQHISELSSYPKSTNDFQPVISETNEESPFNDYLDDHLSGYKDCSNPDSNSLQSTVCKEKVDDFKIVEPSQEVHCSVEFASETGLPSENPERHANNLIDCTPEHNFYVNSSSQFQPIAPDNRSSTEYENVQIEDNTTLQLHVDSDRTGDDEYLYYDPSTMLDFTDELTCGRQVIVMDDGTADDYDNSYFIETGTDDYIPEDNVCLSPEISGSYGNGNGCVYDSSKVEDDLPNKPDADGNTTRCQVNYNPSLSSVVGKCEEVSSSTRLPVLNAMNCMSISDSNDSSITPKAGLNDVVPSGMRTSSEVSSRTNVDTEDYTSETTESYYDFDDDRDEDYKPECNTSDKDEDDDIYSDVAKIRASLCKVSPIKKKVSKKCSKKKESKEINSACTTTRKLPHTTCCKEKVKDKKQKKSTAVTENKDLTEDQARILQEQTRAAMFIDTQRKYLNVILNCTPDNKHIPCGDGDSTIEPVSIETIKSVPEGVSVYGDRTPSKLAAEATLESGIEGECDGDDNNDDEDGILIEDVSNNCQYQMIDDEDNVNLGGIAYYKDLALPFIYINGYKFTPLRDVLLYFNHCQPGCTIPRKTLQNHTTLVKSFSTWEQVYKLELIKMKKGPPIMTGDMLVKLDSLVVLLPDLIRQVIRQHRNTKLKKSKKCKVKLYKSGPLFQKQSP